MTYTALATATVGIGIVGTGTDTVFETAEMALIADDLKVLVQKQDN